MAAPGPLQGSQSHLLSRHALVLVGYTIDNSICPHGVPTPVCGLVMTEVLAVDTKFDQLKI
jgi:hypothetical protein